MPKCTLIDLTGQTINHWQVIRRATSDEIIAAGKTVSKSPYWLCKCSCGITGTKLVLGKTLRNGTSRSCRKCSSLNVANTNFRKHGFVGTKVYRAWVAMKSRCNNPDFEGYENYGGRGIKVCDRWMNSFEAFYKDVGDPPSDKHSLDRYPDVNGDYEPENVRWATCDEQCNNKRTNVYVELYGKRQTAMQWSKELGIGVDTIYRQMRIWGRFDPEKSHGRPPRECV